jgi:hypothetical protein
MTGVSIEEEIAEEVLESLAGKPGERLAAARQGEGAEQPDLEGTQSPLLLIPPSIA